MGNPDFDLDLSRSSRGDEALTNAKRGMQNTESDQSLVTSAATRFEEEDGVLTGLEAFRRVSSLMWINGGR